MSKRQKKSEKSETTKPKAAVTPDLDRHQEKNQKPTEVPTVDHHRSDSQFGQAATVLPETRPIVTQPIAMSDDAMGSTVGAE